MDNYIAIIILKAGDRVYSLSPAPILSSPTQPPMPPDTENGPVQTTHDEMTLTSLYDVNWMSATTSDISYQSVTLSDQTRAPSSTAETRNDSSTQRPMFYDKPVYNIVGPMMYVYFSAANTSDAGFTVDLLFHHPSYLKASLLVLLRL